MFYIASDNRPVAVLLITLAASTGCGTDDAQQLSPPLGNTAVMEGGPSAPDSSASNSSAPPSVRDAAARDAAGSKPDSSPPVAVCDREISPPSCLTLPHNCGPDGNDDCCASPCVPGGTFSRSYDGVSTYFTDPQYVATVSDFRLASMKSRLGGIERSSTPTHRAGRHLEPVRTHCIRRVAGMWPGTSSFPIRARSS